jgi:predicted PurR-regulated permease PerM
MAAKSKARSDEHVEHRDARPALTIDAHSRQIIRAVLALALIALAAWIAAGFLPALAWAIVIAITTWPLYQRFAALTPDRLAPLVAPALFTAIVGVVLLIPLMLALQQLADTSDALVRWIGELQKGGVPVPHWISQLPLTGDVMVDWWRSNLSEPQAATQWLRGINLDSATSWTRALGGEVLHRLMLFFITLLALFFVYRDGGWLAERALATTDRFLGDPGDRLASKMVEAVRGTVNGTIVVAVIEGIIIGTGYWLAGGHNALLLALLTIAFAMLPLGAEIAVTLVSVMLLVQGIGLLPALLLWVFGTAITIVGDNVVWPALVGRSARLPFLLALIGVLGGVETFGLIGLFIGPVIMAVLLVIWREWITPRD